MCRKPARAVKQELYVSPLLGEVCTLPKDLEPEANAESAFRDMVLARSRGAFSVEAEAVVRHMADRTFVSPPAFIGNLGPIDLGPEYLLEDLVAIQRGQLAELRSELEDAVRLVYEARARATALADKLQPLADENRALLAENATLRRKLERGGR